MKYLKPLVQLVLLSVLLSYTVAFAQFNDPYTNPYRSPFSAYPDGSSRPLNPGPSGWNDDEYSSRSQHNLHSNPYSSPSPPREPWTPPAPVTRDFNVWKDGKPTLCTQTKQDVYCY